MSNGQLLHLLTARAESKNPLRVGLIGAGKFGTMFLAQARRVAGLHVLGVADLSLHRAREALTRADQARISNTLPIGLAHNLKLKHKIAAGQPIHLSDVEFDENNAILRLRREMLQRFRE